MLLTIRTTHQPATDLGFLLHKHPEHVHTREFPFGNATVFYPEATEEACTAAVLLDVDPVGMVRGRGGKGGAEDQYVNDRPYVASSLLSVVLSRWFNSALGGRCERKPDLCRPSCRSRHDSRLFPAAAAKDFSARCSSLSAMRSKRPATNSTRACRRSARAGCLRLRSEQRAG